MAIGIHFLQILEHQGEGNVAFFSGFRCLREAGERGNGECVYPNSNYRKNCHKNLD